jgi:hypothetical protein
LLCGRKPSKSGLQNHRFTYHGLAFHPIIKLDSWFENRLFYQPWGGKNGES